MMKDWKLFRKKEQVTPTPLRIEGIGPAPMTPEPDEAEVAAMALLESGLTQNQSSKSHKPNKAHKKNKVCENAKERYEDIAHRMQEEREQQVLAAMRYVAWCEGFLGNGADANATETAAEAEHGLYAHMEAVEREGGELKRRWQHCLAEVTVRSMAAAAQGDEVESEGS